MDAVDRLLLDWYEWNLGWQPVRGYPRDTVFGDGFQSSRQWMGLDDLNEEADQRIVESHARAIDSLIPTLDLRLRVAVNTAVRDLHAGAQVRRNPSWPETQNVDYQRAKDVLTPELIVRGLLDPKEL